MVRAFSACVWRLSQFDPLVFAQIAVAGKLCIFIYSIFSFCPVNVHLTEAQQKWEKLEVALWIWWFLSGHGFAGDLGPFQQGTLERYNSM